MKEEVWKVYVGAGRGGGCGGEGGEVVDEALYPHSLHFCAPTQLVNAGTTVDPRVHKWLSVQHICEEVMGGAYLEQLGVSHMNTSLPPEQMVQYICVRVCVCVCVCVWREKERPHHHVHQLTAATHLSSIIIKQVSTLQEGLLKYTYTQGQQLC